MTEAFECAGCGYAGAPEEVAAELAVCPACGARAPRAAVRGPLDQDRFRYRRSVLGVLARPLAALRPSALRDGEGRPIADVRLRPGAGHVGARVAGAATLTAATVALLFGIGWVDPPRWLSIVLLLWAMPNLLVLAIAVVARLAPGREVVVTARGDDPRLLLHVRPDGRRGAATRLAVEDGDGFELGAIEHHGLRDVVWPLGHLRPLLRIEPADGAPLTVRRADALAPGWVIDREGARVAVYAIRTRASARDELVIEPDAEVDRRLLVAAILVGRP